MVIKTYDVHSWCAYYTLPHIYKKNNTLCVQADQNTIEYNTTDPDAGRLDCEMIYGDTAYSAINV